MDEIFELPYFKDVIYQNKTKAKTSKKDKNVDESLSIDSRPRSNSNSSLSKCSDFSNEEEDVTNLKVQKYLETYEKHLKPLIPDLEKPIIEIL